MTQEVECLLTKAQELVQRDRETKKDLGEDFNIFSITKIERYENNTHSAMLAELLNPRGSHHQGDLFLKAFLRMLLTRVGFNKVEVEAELSKLLSNVRVHKELSLGLRDDNKEIGGRVDLVIDTPRRRIFIENKVDAGDQDKQILRYVNALRKKEDFVFYLTKKGTPASASSQGNLEVGQDYHLLSYDKDILHWLTQTLEQCGNTYVAQGIKQYLNLVKKITNRLEPKYMSELKNTIKANLVAAQAVNSAYNEAILEIKKSFRWDVFQKLETILNEEFTIKIEDEIDSEDSSISIYLKNNNTNGLYFAVASFNGMSHPLYYGICNSMENVNIAFKLNPDYDKTIQTNLRYPVCQYAQTMDGNNLRLNSTGILSQFYNGEESTDYRQNLLNYTVKQIIDFVDSHKELLSD